MKTILKFKSLFTAATFVSLLLCSFAVKATSDDPLPCELRLDSSALKEASEAHVGFAGRLLAATQKNWSGNVHVSPTSLQVVLAMLADTTKGASLDQIISSLGLSESAILRQYSAYMSIAGNGGDPENMLRQMGNSFWLNETVLDGSEDYTVNSDLVAALENDFGASIEQFKDDEIGLADRINKKVAEQSNDLIQKILDEDPSGLIFAILNVLYIKGSFEHPFSKDKTVEESFTTPSGNTTKVAMMNSGKTGFEVKYFEKNGYKYVALPFKRQRQGPVYYMDLVLPPEGSTPTAEETNAFYSEAIANAVMNNGEKVMIKVPKFDFAQQYDLIPILKSMGVEDIFTRNADFSSFTQEGTPPPLYVNQALQAVVAKLDETGFEGAAATFMGVSKTTSIPRAASKSFVADRPFYYFVRQEGIAQDSFSAPDTVTNFIEFHGYIADPSQANSVEKKAESEIPEPVLGINPPRTDFKPDAPSTRPTPVPGTVRPPGIHPPGSPKPATELFSASHKIKIKADSSLSLDEVKQALNKIKAHVTDSKQFDSIKTIHVLISGSKAASIIAQVQELDFVEEIRAAKGQSAPEQAGPLTSPERRLFMMALGNDENQTSTLMTLGQSHNSIFFAHIEKAGSLIFSSSRSLEELNRAFPERIVTDVTESTSFPRYILDFDPEKTNPTELLSLVDNKGAIVLDSVLADRGKILILATAEIAEAIERDSTLNISKEQQSAFLVEDHAFKIPQGFAKEITLASAEVPIFIQLELRDNSDYLEIFSALDKTLKVFGTSFDKEGLGPRMIMLESPADAEQFLKITTDFPDTIAKVEISLEPPSLTYFLAEALERLLEPHSDILDIDQEAEIIENIKLCYSIFGDENFSNNAEIYLAAWKLYLRSDDASKREIEARETVIFEYFENLQKKGKLKMAQLASERDELNSVMPIEDYSSSFTKENWEKARAAVLGTPDQ